MLALVLALTTLVSVPLPAARIVDTPYLHVGIRPQVSIGRDWVGAGVTLQITGKIL